MVSRCDIRMWIVNILNHRLQVYWWLGGCCGLDGARDHCQPQSRTLHKMSDSTS